MTAKELSLKGFFRFHAEFFTGVSLMQKRLIDPTTLITHTFPLSGAKQAFETAGDRNRAVTAQIALAPMMT